MTQPLKDRSEYWNKLWVSKDNEYSDRHIVNSYHRHYIYVQEKMLEYKEEFENLLKKWNKKLHKEEIRDVIINNQSYIKQINNTINEFNVKYKQIQENLQTLNNIFHVMEK